MLACPTIFFLSKTHSSDLKNPMVTSCFLFYFDNIVQIVSFFFPGFSGSGFAK